MSTPESEPRVRMRGVPAKSLTLGGYSVCFFPEQPRRERVEEQDRGTEEEVVQKTVVKVVEAGPVKGLSPPEYVRIHWRNRLVYIIASVSFTLSLNNAYYFPMNIYRYGEQFFLPYTIFTIIIGYPLHVLQVSLGQYSQQGILWVWKCAPLAGGIGLAMLLASVIMSLYYNIFAAYAIIYFAHCFNTDLPWAICSNITSGGGDCIDQVQCILKNGTCPAKYYFYAHILNTPQTSPPDTITLGTFKWWLFVALFFCWFFVYVATLRSARSIGQVSIFLLICSYFSILTLLVVFACVTNTANWHKVRLASYQSASFFSLEMWAVAAIQVFLELGLFIGVPLVYGSFCHFRNLLHVDSIILCLINYINSVIFYILFLLALTVVVCDLDATDLDISNVGIIYVFYSNVFVNLKGNHIWSSLFFFMLFCIIVGTQIAVFETILTCLYDKFINLSKHRWIINFCLCIWFFIVGIIFCFGNGFFNANLLLTMTMWFIIVLLAFFFAFGLVIIYGLSRYLDLMNIMLRHQINTWKKVCLSIFLFLLFCVTVHTCYWFTSTPLDPMVYDRTSVIIGWCLFGLILLPIPLFAILWCLFALITNRNIRRTNTCEKYYEESKGETGQFTTDYKSSYLCKWD